MQRIPPEATTRGFSLIPCPLCGSHGSHYPLYSALDLNWRTDGCFLYVRCNQCNLTFENPSPDPEIFARIYPHGYGSTAAVDEASLDLRIMSAANRHRATVIEKYRQKGTLFDIGCGSGFFMTYMQRNGWLVSGMDSAPEHIAFAREHYGLDTIAQGAWPTLPPAAGTAFFDVATMFHILEHLSDPVRALTAARNIIDPDGILIIETPNIMSLPARLFGRHWVALDAPRHLVLFSHRTLRICLEKAGFSKIIISSYSPSTMDYSESLRLALSGFLRKPTLKPHSERTISAGAARHHRMDKVPLSLHSGLHLFERRFYALLNSIADRAGNGCNLLAVARR